VALALTSLDNFVLLQIRPDFTISVIGTGIFHEIPRARYVVRGEGIGGDALFYAGLSKERRGRLALVGPCRVPR
jgi:hypothetical protein